MAEFDHIADSCAKVVNRQQLEKPAKEFGEFIGSLPKDGVLALVGMAGGIAAPRVMPQVEEVLTNKVGNAQQIFKEGIPKLEEPILATLDGASTKMSKGSKVNPGVNEVPDKSRYLIKKKAGEPAF